MMFPKGGWELDETIEDAARRETMEEAGVLGVVGKKLGVWSFKSKSQDTFHEGHMLSFKVTDELDCWPEKDVRSRVWVSADEARKLCAHEWMKEALDRFIVQLDEDQGEPRPPTLLDLLRLDESSFSEEEEDEVNCTLSHFQMKEEECHIHLFMHHLPISPCSTEKSKMSRVSQSGEEDVDRIALLVN
ncbi:OLC1v1014369C2 [Oldenlandia corymbosa var. corymbosa]|nr:OLC1v1014369C2 [Oldenlandia corymbosa var. corymbosa]